MLRKKEIEQHRRSSNESHLKSSSSNSPGPRDQARAISLSETVSRKDKCRTTGETLLAEVRGLVGAEGCPHKVFVGRDGSFAPQPHPFQISFWLCDRETGELWIPSELDTSWTLDEDRLPISKVQWSQGGVRVRTTCFSRWMDAYQQLLTCSRVAVQNEQSRIRRLTLYVLLRPSPLLKEEEQGACREMASDGSVVTVDGVCALVLKRPHVDVAEDKVLEALNVLPLTKDVRLVGGEEGIRAALTYHLELSEGEEIDFDFYCSSQKQEADTSWLADQEFDANLMCVKSVWQNRVPMKLSLPDKRYEDCFYSSLYYMLIMMTGSELWPGPLNYREFFLHDAVDMVDALEKAGLSDVARGALDLFEFDKGDRYGDGLGGSLYALWLHACMTADRAYLREVYPRIRRGCRLIKEMRAECLSAEFADSALWGLFPPSESQDNFGKPAHLYVDNWWAIIGLKSAMLAAKELNELDDYREFEHEYLGLFDCVQTSVNRVMKEENLSYMPAFADYWPEEGRAIDGAHRILGDAQMAWAHRPVLTPVISLGVKMPLVPFSESYRKYWERAGRFSKYDCGWFVEYEDCFWGYNVALAAPLMTLGMNDVALMNIEWSLNNQSCPGGWMEAMKSQTLPDGTKVMTPGVVGDTPHGWVAAHFVLFLRQMLFREEGDQLVLLSCVPLSWFEQGERIEVRNAPTFFGEFGFVVESRKTEGIIDIQFLGETPPGGYVLHLPEAENVLGVILDGKERLSVSQSTVSLPSGVRAVEIRYRDA